MTEPDPIPLETAPPPPPPTRPPPPPPPALPMPPTRPSRWRTCLAVALSVLGVLLVVAIVAGFLIHVDKVLISPGEATPLDSSVVMISGAPTYDNPNHVLFLTVRVSNEDPTLWRYVVASLDPDIDIEDRTNVVGCLSPEDNVTYNTLLMGQSQNDAKYVALTRLGYTVTADPARVTVVYACPGAPAYGIVNVGDRVVALGNDPVSSSAQLVTLVRAHEPGETLDITVERDGVTRVAKVVAGRISADGTKCKAVDPGGVQRGHDDTGAACIGQASQDFVMYHFPIDVTINTDRVGGPSAGLAFTLAIIDQLTPGKLTDGKRVAVTGAIANDGTVEPVGGVEQKAITARRNGVQLMMVPKSEVRDARKGAGGMKVVGVATLDDALAALEHAGGASVPHVASVAARS